MTWLGRRRVNLLDTIKRASPGAVVPTEYVACGMGEGSMSEGRGEEGARVCVCVCGVVVIDRGEW